MQIAFAIILQISNYCARALPVLRSKISVGNNVGYKYKMEDDRRTAKELIMAILEKCKQALPELAILTQRIDKLALPQPQKVRKKDCLNPTFLVRLSECGQNIRLILQNALSYQFTGKQTLSRLYNEYMTVIYDIRKYHDQAHRAHDLHKNSTAQKQTLLDQLKLETKRREELERQLQRMVREREHEGRDWEGRLRSAGGAREDDINISHISNISRRGVMGQLYGGEKFTGHIEQDREYLVETGRLRKRILELESQMEEREVTHQRELETQKIEILELESKFQELVRSSFEGQSLRSESRAVKVPEVVWDYDDMYRLMLLQGATIEEYLNQQQYD